jgi:hypothetical protein
MPSNTEKDLGVDEPMDFLPKRLKFKTEEELIESRRKS